MTTPRSGLSISKRWNEQLNECKARAERMDLNPEQTETFKKLFEQVERKIRICNLEEQEVQKSFSYLLINELLTQLESRLKKEDWLAQFQRLKERVQTLPKKIEQLDSMIAELGPLIEQYNSDNNKELDFNRSTKIASLCWQLTHQLEKMSLDTKLREKVAKEKEANATTVVVDQKPCELVLLWNEPPKRLLNFSCLFCPPKASDDALYQMNVITTKP